MAQIKSALLFFYILKLKICSSAESDDYVFIKIEKMF